MYGNICKQAFRIGGTLLEITAAAQWINRYFELFDQGVTRFVHNLHTVAGGFFTPFFELVSFFGKGGIFLILLSLCLTLMKSKRHIGTAMLLSVTIGAIVTNLFLKIVIARPRPYADESSMYYELWKLVGQNMESDKSFPSGHTTAAVACMVPVIIFSKPRLKLAALCFCILMGIARIYLVVHFPSDVLAGVIVGIIAGCLGTLIAIKLPARWYEWEAFPEGKHAK